MPICGVKQHINYPHLSKCNKHTVYNLKNVYNLKIKKYQKISKISTCQYIDIPPPSKVTNNRLLVVAIKQSANIRIFVYN